MVTEQELRDVLTAEADDPAAETYTLGLSDRALAAAGRGGRRRWSRVVPGIAVGTAFVVAGVFGVSALGGSGGKRVTAVDVPKMLANPAAQSALVDFEVECTDKAAPKMAMDWVWDPGSRQYHPVDGSVYTSFTPSPNGTRVLVVQGIDTARWGVGGWSDAVGMQVPLHDKGDGLELRWTADGSELTSVLRLDVGPDKNSAVTVSNKTADFYDPATGAKRSVPIPPAVLDAAAGGDWQLLQWQGNHDTVLFPLLKTTGDRIQWLNAAGQPVRTVLLQNGLTAGSVNGISTPYLAGYLSPDGRYLADTDGKSMATFDLTASGRRLGLISADGIMFRTDSSLWAADHEIIITVDPAMKDVGKPGAKEISKTGHSPVYRVLGPDLKVIEETQFVLPDDPKGYCSSWPISWAPKTQFPNAFVP